MWWEKLSSVGVLVCADLALACSALPGTDPVAGQGGRAHHTADTAVEYTKQAPRGSRKGREAQEERRAQLHSAQPASISHGKQAPARGPAHHSAPPRHPCSSNPTAEHSVAAGSRARRDPTRLDSTRGASTQHRGAGSTVGRGG